MLVVTIIDVIEYVTHCKVYERFINYIMFGIVVRGVIIK